jgi:uncharacterized protein (TIGR00106 family)
MSVIAEISLFPMDKGIHLGEHVSKAVTVIRESGLSFQVGPMGTSIEGPWERVIGVVDRCVRALKEESDRVYVVIKIDYASGEEERMKKKVQSASRVSP